MQGGVAALLSVLVETMLPIVALTVIGAAFEWWIGLDVEPLNTVILYALLPALVFHSLVTSTLAGGTTLRLVGGVWAFTAIMLVVAWGVGRATGATGETLSALVLASAIPNVGNFGIPVSTFAFGPVGRTTAVVFVAAQNVLTLTVGVYIAARGAGTVATSALRRIVEFPLVYAIVLAVVVRATVDPAGGNLMRTIELTGNASIPLFLIVLGASLVQADIGATLRSVTPAVTLKLVVAPVVGVGIALGLGIERPAVLRTFVLEAAAPVAITPLSLAIEFTADGTGPAYLSTAILVTAILGIPLAAGLILVLQSGVLPAAL
jgi:predicted permease